MMGVSRLNEDEFDNPLEEDWRGCRLWRQAYGCCLALRLLFSYQEESGYSRLQGHSRLSPGRKLFSIFLEQARTRRQSLGLEMRKLLDALRFGEVEYDFEVMACSGDAPEAGQPIHDGEDCAEFRASLLWKLDANMKVRFLMKMKT